MTTTAKAPEAAAPEGAVEEKSANARSARAATAVADTLHGKIAEVQAEIGVMPKDRTVEVKKDGQLQYRYDYLSESALMSAVRDKLARRGVAVYVSVVSQRKEGNLTLVETALTFADGATGDTFTVSGQGQGADPSDKGVYKATTGAVRYMLWKTFLVPTEGDDPNQPHEVSAAASDTPMSVQDAMTRVEHFALDAKPWIKEAAVGFYKELEGAFPPKFGDLPDRLRFDLLRRLQRVVLELESNRNFDPGADMTQTQTVVRLAFSKAFDGLAVAGPDPFEGPVPF